MKRRGFLKLSGAALAASLTRCGPSPEIDGSSWDIEVVDDLLAGHLMFDANGRQWTVSPEDREILIVGGGLAGLAAAHALRQRDMVLCELSDKMGGSAAFGSFQGLAFAQGAHYDLEYPAYYGKEVLALLEGLGIVAFNALRDTWEFVENRYLIPPSIANRCWVHGRLRDDVLPESDETALFERLLAPYEGLMPQPIRLLRGDLRHLDGISFLHFLLQKGLPGSPRFRECLDYHMKDDYGADADEVSALAGIHYYRCRPYYSRDVAIFSPPIGNGYFVDKLLAGLPPESVRTGHLVCGIQPETDHFLVRVLNTRDLRPVVFRVKKIVYAGHKQGLRYAFPQEAARFANLTYAPWMVMTFIVEGLDHVPTYWQNEVLGPDDRFLGFINGKAQATAPDGEFSAITAYYCLPRSQRELLLTVESRKAAWAEAAARTIQTVLGGEISSSIRKVSIKLHGHGMPIPIPNYLFRDANAGRSHQNLVFAGVDCGRLPLLFEALDSGLTAAALCGNTG